MNTYIIKHQHGETKIRAWDRVSAQLKFRKKYDIDFISIRKGKNEKD